MLHSYCCLLFVTYTSFWLLLSIMLVISVTKTVSANMYSTTISNLLPGTAYTFRVQASNGPLRNGPLSDQKSATTNPSIVLPGPIGSIQYRVVGGTSLELSWAAPSRYDHLYTSFKDKFTLWSPATVGHVNSLHQQGPIIQSHSCMSSTFLTFL